MLPHPDNVLRSSPHALDENPPSIGHSKQPLSKSKQTH